MMRGDQAALEVNGLTIVRRRRTLVRETSFVARAGEMTWIIGENGAGKSSLLRVLAGHARPRGRIIAHHLDTTLYYAPVMGIPRDVSVHAWRLLHHRLINGADALIGDADSLVPAVPENALLGTLSTGEAKRMVLWSLLRAPADCLLLDEPYEHLSPSAKSRLTGILEQRSRQSVVIVATNQDVPRNGLMQVMTIE